jgi:hypothetical protein
MSSVIASSGATYSYFPVTSSSGLLLRPQQFALATLLCTSIPSVPSLSPILLRDRSRHSNATKNDATIVRSKAHWYRWATFSARLFGTNRHFESFPFQFYVLRLTLAGRRQRSKSMGYMERAVYAEDTVGTTENVILDT